LYDNINVYKSDEISVNQIR